MGYIGNAPFGGLITGDNVLDGSIKAEDLAPGAAVPSQTGQSGKYLTTDGTNASWGAIVTGVRVTGITYPGNDTAVAPAGGQTVTLAGSGFVATPTVFVDGTIAPSVSFVSSSQITFTVPAKSAGTYHVYVVNPDGSTAIFVNGISYSGVPAWTTAAGSLGAYPETFSIQLVATGDAPIVYTLTTGSTLPAGVSLSSSGLISGTLGTEQTFSFSVDAVDAQNQETPRSFSVTVVLADPYFEYNAILLSGDGANGAQNNTFLDSSTNNFTITRNGNTTQGAFSPFSQTGWSNYFDGSGDFLSTPANVSAFDFTGTKTMTFECWVYFTGFPDNATFIDIAEVNPFRIVYGGGNITWQATPAAVTVVTAAYTLSANTWHHVAFVRDVDTASIYVNGSRVGTNTYTSNWGASGATLHVGCNRGNTWFLQGYMSNVRLVKGTAVYSGTTYTVPTAPLTAITNTSLLTCQSNRFIDNSTNAFAITRNGDVSVQAFSPFNPITPYSTSAVGGSGYFDGSGDSLAGGANTALALPGAFTFECWFYPNSFDQVSNIGDTIFSTLAVGSFTVGRTDSATGNLWGIAETAVAWRLTSSTLPTNRAWNHIVAVRNSGNTLSLFLNGTRIATTTLSTSFAQNGFSIGSDNNVANSFLDGYLANVRLVKGTAVYDPTASTLTVPTAPLTAITNTSLLLNYTNAGIYDATSKNNLETVGNAQISTTQSKFGGSSMYFDGDDKLVGRTSPNLNMGSGDFTVECWVYWAGTTTSYQNFVGSNSSSFVGNATFFRVWGTTVATLGSKVGIGNPTHDATSSVYSVSSLAANTWTHVAATRSNGVIRLFINGVLERTGPSDTSTYDFGDNGICVGQAPWDGANGYYTGYIDDLRITKGYARYTANFTPPTTANKLR